MAARDTVGYSTEELLALIDHLETKNDSLEERNEYLTRQLEGLEA